MIGLEDAAHTFEYDDYYKILPDLNGWSSDQKELELELGVKKTCLSIEY